MPAPAQAVAACQFADVICHGNTTVHVSHALQQAIQSAATPCNEVCNAYILIYSMLYNLEALKSHLTGSRSMSSDEKLRYNAPLIGQLIGLE